MPDALITSEHFPYLRATVTVRSQIQEVETLLDTGFSGYVVLPEGSLGEDVAPDFYTVWQVADGRKISAPLYEGTITIGEAEPIDALITLLGDEPILGREVIGRFSITLDHGLRVTVER